MNSVPLSQLLMEMNADNSYCYPDSQPEPSREYQCQCVTDKHQPASICIEHFTIRADDERNLSNVAGNLSDFVCSVVLGIVLRVTTNLENLECSGISLNMENSGNSVNSVQPWGKIVTIKVFLVRHSNICVKQLLTV